MGAVFGGSHGVATWPSPGCFSHSVQPRLHLDHCHGSRIFPFPELVPAAKKARFFRVSITIAPGGVFHMILQSHTSEGPGDFLLPGLSPTASPITGGRVVVTP